MRESALLLKEYVKEDRVEEVRVLLDQFDSVEAICELLTYELNSVSVVSWAIRSSSFRCFISMLQAAVPYDANVLKAQDRFGLTPLHYAGVYSGSGCLDVILQNGSCSVVDLMSLCDREGNTPLHFCALGSPAPFATMLDALGEEASEFIQKKNDAGCTVLHLATQNRDIEKRGDSSPLLSMLSTSTETRTTDRQPANVKIINEFLDHIWEEGWRGDDSCLHLVFQGLGEQSHRGLMEPNNRGTTALHYVTSRLDQEQFYDVVKIMERDQALSLEDYMLLDDHGKSSMSNIVRAAKKMVARNQFSELEKLLLHLAEPYVMEVMLSLQSGSITTSTVFSSAVQRGSLDCIEVICDLLGNDAISLMFTGNKRCVTPIHDAVSSNHAACLQYMLDFAGDAVVGLLKMQLSDTKETPMHLAASKGHEDCFRIMLNKLDDKALSVFHITDKNRQNISTAVITRASIAMLDLVLDKHEALGIDIVDELKRYSLRTILKCFATSGYMRGLQLYVGDNREDVRRALARINSTEWREIIVEAVKNGHLYFVDEIFSYLTQCENRRELYIRNASARTRYFHAWRSFLRDVVETNGEGVIPDMMDTLIRWVRADIMSSERMMSLVWGHPDEGPVQGLFSKSTDNDAIHQYLELLCCIRENEDALLPDILKLLSLKNDQALSLGMVVMAKGDPGLIDHYNELYRHYYIGSIDQDVIDQVHMRGYLSWHHLAQLVDGWRQDHWVSARLMVQPFVPTSVKQVQDVLQRHKPDWAVHLMDHNSRYLQSELPRSVLLYLDYVLRDRHNRDSFRTQFASNGRTAQMMRALQVGLDIHDRVRYARQHDETSDHAEGYDDDGFLEGARATLQEAMDHITPGSEDDQSSVRDTLYACFSILAHVDLLSMTTDLVDIPKQPGQNVSVPFHANEFGNPEERANILRIVVNGVINSYRYYKDNDLLNKFYGHLYGGFCIEARTRKLFEDYSRRSGHAILKVFGDYVLEMAHVVPLIFLASGESICVESLKHFIYTRSGGILFENDEDYAPSGRMTEDGLMRYADDALQWDPGLSLIWPEDGGALDQPFDYMNRIVLFQAVCRGYLQRHHSSLATGSIFNCDGGGGAASTGRETLDSDEEFVIV